MPALLILLALFASDPAPQPAAPARGAIEATIRGTKQPLTVELLRRDDEGNDWHEVEHKNLPAAERRIRFEKLEPGVYQVLVKGEQKTEQHATKVVVGSTDTRRITINIEPFVLSGRVTLGGVDLGFGAATFRHKEFHWRGALALGGDGSFQVPFWQRGEFSYTVRGAAMATSYTHATKIEGNAVAIDIPDGRITGIIRDLKTGAPAGGVTVGLQTSTEDGEAHVRITTNANGTFDFTGIKYGKHTVRFLSPQHLEPEPIVFNLDASNRLRELDVKLDSGRAVPLVVIDAENDPVEKATVFAVTNGKLRARATTDEDGRTNLPIPAGETATVFVVAPQGGFGVLRLDREHEKGRVRVHLPRASSSLLIRAQTVDGNRMPPFSLLMRYNGELVPTEIADELAAAQGLRLATGPSSEALLRNIPSGSYEFWPYRTEEEVQAIVAAGDFAAPIQVNVRTGENKIAVKFAAKR